MPLIVESRRRTFEKLRKVYDSPAFVDTTSKGPDPWRRFSPFFPHGGIPIPFSPGYFSMSVEGLWQGLKVFESEGIDRQRFYKTNMKGLERTVRRFGKVLGHAKGISGEEELLSYQEARYQLYLPSYLWVLENKLEAEIKELKELAEMRTVLLLDYETNEDADNLTKPLSHAGLIKKFCEGVFPRP